MLLLLDANMSPKTAALLRRRFSFDAISLAEIKQTHLSDREVIELARQQHRIIITQDLDYGELYHETDPTFGVIILRLQDQRSPNVNQVLENFFAKRMRMIRHGYHKSLNSSCKPSSCYFFGNGAKFKHTSGRDMPVL